MAEVGRLRLDGARELRAQLKAAGHGVQELKDANLGAAEVVAAEARRTAPLGPAPGHIRDTIRPAGTQAAAIVRVGTARLPYSKPVHWGHRRPGLAQTKVPAQPWVYAAALATTDKWLPQYVQHIDRIIQTVEGTTTP